MQGLRGLIAPPIVSRLTAIFLSRFMLDLRGLYFSEDDPSGDPARFDNDRRHNTSSYVSSSRVIGNLAATLETQDYDRNRSDTGGEQAEEEYERDPFEAGLRGGLEDEQ